MKAKYNEIGAGYNTFRTADPYLAGGLKALINPTKGKTYLDIGCGTGNYTKAVFPNEVNVIGIDPSELMLESARNQGTSFTWKIGNAEKTGLNDNSIDGILASLTIHHWKDLNAGFKEMSRVIKEGGKMVIFTSSPNQMKGYWLRRYFPKMLKDSILQMPSVVAISKSLESAGFTIELEEPYFVKDDLQDLFLYAGKHRPKLYLDKNVRQGISSFSNLANAEEVNNGLAKLESDINSGRIEDIIKTYENSNGDYLFLSAIKKAV